MTTMWRFYDGTNLPAARLLVSAGLLPVDTRVS
jgi:hypothetical protein